MSIFGDQEMKNATILLVDDEPELLSVLAEQLESRAEKVFPCCGGAEALKTLENTDVDLVITDYRMPGMSGLALREEIRKIRPWLPVLILTGNDHEPELLRALPEGGFDFLEKPFRFEVMLNRVRNSVRHGRMMRTAWEKLRRDSPAEADASVRLPWNDMVDRFEAALSSMLK